MVLSIKLGQIIIKRFLKFNMYLLAIATDSHKTEPRNNNNNNDNNNNNKVMKLAPLRLSSIDLS